MEVFLAISCFFLILLGNSSGPGQSYTSRRTEQDSYDPIRVAELVNRVKSGDTRAFWDLMIIFEVKIYNFCYRKVGNKQTAEDISRDTFLRAYEKIGQLKDAAKFQSWLFRMALNKCTDYFRDATRFGQRDNKEDPDADPFTTIPDSGKSPEEEVAEKERKRRLEEEYAKLSEDQKDVINLVHYQGFKYAEAAGILNIPDGTLKSKLNRALTLLENQLEDLRK